MRSKQAMPTNAAKEKVRELKRLVGYVQACTPERFNEAYETGDLDNFQVSLYGLDSVLFYMKRQLAEAEKEVN